MKILRSYSQSERAYADAAFLSSMGISATVIDERALGGNLLGVSSPDIRIELPDDEHSKALELLASKDSQQAPEIASSTPAVAETNLLGLFRSILIFDVCCYAAYVGFPSHFVVEPPASVSDYLVSLAFSDALWRLAFVSYWPLIIFGVLSNVLCYWFSSIGRTLFAVTVVWSVLVQLGPPPQIFGPALGFLGSLQSILTSIALALMYWSPLRDRFR